MGKFILSLFTLISIATVARAQRLEGRIGLPALRGTYITLLSTRGERHLPMDSARIAQDGTFKFVNALNAAGFYQLAVRDSDRVDLIMDPRESIVSVEFAGLPLQSNIAVQESDENKRLWEYKLVSKESQAIQTSVADQRMHVDPRDSVQLNEMDSVVLRAQRMQRDHLVRLIQGAPGSYFAKLVQSDIGVEKTAGKGPMAVARVFNFSDPSLMRSSVFDKAVMIFLQNLNAVSESQFVVASDTLMNLAAHDAQCEAYMLDHLIDLFGTYGPDQALQHLIDRYVAPTGSSAMVEPALRAKVDEMLKLAVGAVGADVLLNDHGKEIRLSQLASHEKYTALFFYSSTCDHCHAQMPMLKEVYSDYSAKGFDVIGIALDADSAEFNKSIQENAIPWRCYSEFIGWGATVAKTYQVRSTPTFFLLDDRLRIIGKPYDAVELGTELRELLK